MRLVLHEMTHMERVVQIFMKGNIETIRGMRLINLGTKDISI